MNIKMSEKVEIGDMANFLSIIRVGGNALDVREILYAQSIPENQTLYIQFKNGDNLLIEDQNEIEAFWRFFSTSRSE